MEDILTQLAQQGGKPPIEVPGQPATLDGLIQQLIGSGVGSTPESPGMGAQQAVEPPATLIEQVTAPQQVQTPNPVNKKIISEVVPKPTKKEEKQLIKNPIELIYGKEYYGLDEANPKHQPIIASFFDKSIPSLMTSKDGKKDPSKVQSVAWCAAFVDHVLNDLGQPSLKYEKDKYDIVRAAKYLQYGENVDNDPQLGDLAVIQNPKNGLFHVGFFAGEGEKGKIKILGGNQNNQVNVSSYDTSRIKGFRRIGDLETVSPETLIKISEDIQGQGGTR